MEVFTLILPVFAVLVTGYVVARVGFLPDTVGAALIQFAFNVAIPAMLFVVIAQEDIANLLNWPFISVFGGVVGVVFVVVLLGSLYWRRSELGAATMLATICVGSNTGIIALPLLHTMFGKKAVVLAAIANVVIVILFLVQILLLEASQMKDPQNKQSTLTHIKNAILNPVIFSTILGVAFAITPFALPQIVADYLDILASALAPCALFAIGMSIQPATVTRSGPVILFASAVKLVALPLLAFAVAKLLDLDSLLTIAAVVAAAVPTAKSEFVLAKQYHQSEELVADTISVTTAISVVTLIAWLLLLSRVYPDSFSLG